MGVRVLLLGAIAGMMLGVLSRGTQIVAKNMAVAA
jgi:hypothetical protein